MFSASILSIKLKIKTMLNKCIKTIKTSLGYKQQALKIMQI